MLSCAKCDKPEFLIRGLCRECEPELHKRYFANLDQMGNAQFQFHEETGKSALEDWHAFESFLIANRDKYPDIQPKGAHD